MSRALIKLVELNLGILTPGRQMTATMNCPGLSSRLTEERRGRVSAMKIKKDDSRVESSSATGYGFGTRFVPPVRPQRLKARSRCGTWGMPKGIPQYESGT